MIENEFYGDEFEQLLKEKADQFSMYPSKRVWHSIYNNLHPGRRWPSVVISLVLISSLMLIGYLNTGENSITSQINKNTISKPSNEKTDDLNSTPQISRKSQLSPIAVTAHKSAYAYNHAFDDVITNETDMYTYTVVKSNRPVYLQNPAYATDVNTATDIKLPVDNIAAANNNSQDIVQSIEAYIKSNKIFSDIAANNKKYKGNSSKSADKNNTVTDADDINLPSADNSNSLSSLTDNSAKTDVSKLPKTDVKALAGISKMTDNSNTTKTTEEKAWIENYALQNKPAAKKWKGRLGYQLYVTPAVNYRKLTSKTQYSATPFAQGDINRSISQKPGIGVEAGIGLNYAVAKKLQLKGGVQFNYTNYNIAADETNHPIVTNILLNDPASGLSYSSARVSTVSNPYNSTALKPVTLHNTTYQISIPLGFAYKLSSQNNVNWFAGASIQPSYIFGGNAHIISSDLKSYVSEPSSIRSWNLNLGFETYMNFKMGAYNLQVGPQVRYQVNSTYKKNVALVEKPYAVGLKFGLTKGF
jgi:hypothetical protein